MQLGGAYPFAGRSNGSARFDVFDTFDVTLRK